MQQKAKITPEYVRKLTKPTEEFLCSVHANIYDIYFFQFKIRDVDSGVTVFEVQRDPDYARSVLKIENDAYRLISYQFSPDFFKIKTIGTTLIFGIGDKPVKNLMMIERHYLGDELLKSYEFTFPFCIPNSTNTWEAIYDVPKLSEDQTLQMILNPNLTKSDSFYFVDNELVLHHRAEYDYATLFTKQLFAQQQRQQK